MYLHPLQERTFLPNQQSVVWTFLTLVISIATHLGIKTGPTIHNRHLLFLPLVHLHSIREKLANGSTLPPPKYDQRITSNETYNQSSLSRSQTVIYNGTNQVLRSSTGSKGNSTQTTSSTQSINTLYQPSSPPISRSLRPTVNDGIIGTDDRVSVTDAYNTTEYPWSSIVRLYLIYPDGTRGGCSGAVISGPDNRSSAHVLTAAHCVYSSNRGGWIDITGQTESYVSPGADGSQEPFRQVGIQNIRSYSR